MKAGMMPIIRRARGWRLYGIDGSRYLDLCSDGGRAILGRKNSGLGTLAKACIDSGLVSEFTSIWTGRLKKALASFLPGCDSIFTFPTSIEARAAITASGFGQHAGALKTAMAFGEYRQDVDHVSEIRKEDGAVLVDLPLPALWSFGIVATPKDADLRLLEELKEAEAAGSGIPALKTALATRVLAEFKAFKVKYNEAHWSTIDPYIKGLFTRSGPWLYPAYEKAEHERIFCECQAEGILISPLYQQPSLVPGEFDLGEVAGLKTIAGRAKEA